jgi:hypothetical protein
MKQPLLALMATALFLASCEQSITLSGSVTVPADVQKLFSSSEPGRVAVWVRRSDGNSWIDSRLLFVLCDPKEEPLVVPFRISKLQCAHEAIVEARVDRVPARLVPTSRCGLFTGSSADLSGDGTLASASQIVFPGEKGGSCTSGAATVDLRVLSTGK